MRQFVILSFILILSGLVSGCNTLGGLGQDISQTGAALDNAAGWSQTQINEATKDTEEDINYSENNR